MGHRILCHNFHAGFAEIDLISLRSAGIHYIEVKNYVSANRIHPLETLTGHKINKMRQASKVFCQSYMDYVCQKNKQKSLDKNIIIDIVALDPSFDLIWVKSDTLFEYFPGVF